MGKNIYDFNSFNFRFVRDFNAIYDQVLLVFIVWVLINICSSLLVFEALSVEYIFRGIIFKKQKFMILSSDFPKSDFMAAAPPLLAVFFVFGMRLYISD